MSKRPKDQLRDSTAQPVFHNGQRVGWVGRSPTGSARMFVWTQPIEFRDLTRLNLSNDYGSHGYSMSTKLLHNLKADGVAKILHHESEREIPLSDFEASAYRARAHDFLDVPSHKRPSDDQFVYVVK